MVGDSLCGVQVWIRRCFQSQYVMDVCICKLSWFCVSVLLSMIDCDSKGGWCSEHDRFEGRLVFGAFVGLVNKRHVACTSCRDIGDICKNFCGKPAEVFSWTKLVQYSLRHNSTLRPREVLSPTSLSKLLRSRFQT